MNKETKLQFVKLFEATSDFLDVEETPEYDSIDFLPIASDRHEHTEAVLALAKDINNACDTPGVEQNTSTAPTKPAIN